jgi:hypothetical protein
MIFTMCDYKINSIVHGMVMQPLSAKRFPPAALVKWVQWQYSWITRKTLVQKAL